MKSDSRQARRDAARMSRSNDKKKPLGAALPRTDDDLDRLSEITERDFDEALAEALPTTRALLEATEDDGDSGSNS
jgi:hypothetical protein